MRKLNISRTKIFHGVCCTPMNPKGTPEDTWVVGKEMVIIPDLKEQLDALFANEPLYTRPALSTPEEIIKSAITHKLVASELSKPHDGPYHIAKQMTTRYFIVDEYGNTAYYADGHDSQLVLCDCDDYSFEEAADRIENIVERHAT